MAPRKAQQKAPKKPKLANDQTKLQNVIKRLNDLSLEFTSEIETFANESIEPLKPGWGLLGNPQEEERYYAEYQRTGNAENEVVAENRETIGTPDSGGQPSEPAVEGERSAAEVAEENSQEEDPQADAQLRQEIKVEEDGYDGVDIGDPESPEFGKDFVEVNGSYIHVTTYFGDRWIEMIRELYAVRPAQQPENMNLVLHPHQLKAAAQLDFLCRSRFHGGILADGMGVGKTLTAITLMDKVKNDPGFSLVACPKTLCLQWKAEIENAWKEGCALRTYILEGTSMTAHELLALGVDVIICSYDQIEASERARRALPEALDTYNNDQTGTLKKPTRPQAVLHSSFWRELNLPIKRLVLDEAQTINKRDGIRHQAIKNLFYQAIIPLSGSPAHNKWHDFSGLVDFLQDHPFTDHGSFLKAFSSVDHDGKTDRPDLPRVRLLQRFIQAFTIARPATVLRVKDCHIFHSKFNIRESHSRVIETLTIQYANLSAMNKGKNANDQENNHAALSYAVKAQMMSLHPILYEEVLAARATADDLVDMNDDDPVQGYVALDRATRGGAERDLWLEKVRNAENVSHGSDRVCRFLQVYEYFRRHKPDQKMVVFSQYLKFLDILAEALKRTHGVQALRFDGTIDHHQRLKIQQQFADGDASVPLLMTAGAGAYGLNITQASIMIQTEIWWNKSVEAQALARIWRQKQEREVTAVLLYGENSTIDLEVHRVQTKKATINSEVMEAIIRKPDEEPDIRALMSPMVIAPYGIIKREIL